MEKKQKEMILNIMTLFIMELHIFHILNLFLNFILFDLTFMIIKYILTEAFTNKDERIINFF